jgi:hypothetical protein
MPTSTSCVSSSQPIINDPSLVRHVSDCPGILPAPSPAARRNSSNMPQAVARGAGAGHIADAREGMRSSPTLGGELLIDSIASDVPAPKPISRNAVYRDTFVQQKADVNDRLADLHGCPGALHGHALYLDGPEMRTTAALLGKGWPAERLHVPNNCASDCEIMRA